MHSGGDSTLSGAIVSASETARNKEIRMTHRSLISMGE
jgi:hypothetical protein